MTITFRKLHPTFVAEASAVDLRQVHDAETLEAIRRGMDEFAVLVFRDQPFTDEEQMAFARRFDGVLHEKTGAAALGRSRLGTEAIADISNVAPDGELFAPDDRRRAYALGNRLWHTDASFEDPSGRYSMLSARVVPPVRTETEFADARTAYEALDDATRTSIETLRVHHSIAYSRETLGFEFSAEERAKLPGAVQPLVRTNPRTGRRALYLASHAAHVVDWPLPEGRLLLRELIDHVTEPSFVYAHVWRPNDLVIWDNLATMHRGRPFDDATHRREMRRVTTLDLPHAIETA